MHLPALFPQASSSSLQQYCCGSMEVSFGGFSSPLLKVALCIKLRDLTQHKEL